MENENIIDVGTGFDSNELSVSPAASGYLNETGRWAKFLAVIGFIFVGLLVIFGLFAGTIFSSLGSPVPFPGFMMGLIYIAMGILYFFPLYYLFRFATRLKGALTTKSARELESAFENLKSHYKFIAVLMIIVLGIYVFVGGIALLMMAF